MGRECPRQTSVLKGAAKSWAQADVHQSSSFFRIKLLHAIGQAVRSCSNQCTAVSQDPFRNQAAWVPKRTKTSTLSEALHYFTAHVMPIASKQPAFSLVIRRPPTSTWAKPATSTPKCGPAGCESLRTAGLGRNGEWHHVLGKQSTVQSQIPALATKLHLHKAISVRESA